MSRVVHLSNEAHQQAKEYCNEHGLRMSDWVAELIAAAVQTQESKRPATSVNEDLPRKKPLTKITESSDEAALSAYARPPFWATSL